MRMTAPIPMDDNPYSAPQAWCYEKLQAQREEWSDDAPRGLLHHEFDPTGLLFFDAAQRSGLVIDALRFVFDALAWAPDLLHNPPEIQIPGPELCLAVVRYAEEIFDAEGIEALGDWEIVTGNDVGRFIGAMVGNGLIEASAQANLRDFHTVGPLCHCAG